MFGDILSDCAAMVTGSIGMLPSASIKEKNDDDRSKGIYEPIHGSAPDIAGLDVANPLAMILSFAMLLKYSLNQSKESDLIVEVVRNVLAKGIKNTRYHATRTF